MIHLENVLKISLQDVLKMSWRRFENVLKTSWKRLEDALNTYGQDEYIGLDQDVLKTSSEDMRLRRTYSSWWRRLEDVFKTSPANEDKRRLQDIFKTNVCWDGISLRHFVFAHSLLIEGYGKYALPLRKEPVIAPFVEHFKIATLRKFY